METHKISIKRTLLIAGLILTVFASSLVIGINLGYYGGYLKGYNQALSDITDKTGITFEWRDLKDGSYEILAYYQDRLIASGLAEIHITVYQYRDGKLISKSHHAGVLTNIGKDYIEDQLGDTPSTTPAKYISCSNDASSPSATWTQIPTEINANGLTRATATYTSTGVGTWNQTHTFAITGTQSVRLYGLQWDSTPVSNNNLLCADTSTPRSCANGDTLKVTFQCSVT